jgi:hypothetical protein
MPWWPSCLFKKFSGLECPGCGMTRAVHATLHGELGKAFRFNPVGMVLLPLALCGLAVEVWGWVCAKPPPFRLHVGARGAKILMWIVLSFWILRNIPYWPLTLLAPP